MSGFSHSNSGVHFLLIAIDMFSRYVFVEGLKNKTMEATTRGFEAIFEREQRSPQYLQTDLGLEFWNKDMKVLLKDYGVLKHYGAIQSVKSSMAERTVRTVKGKLYKYMHGEKSKRYMDQLQSIVKGINNSYSRAVKMKPNQVTVEKQNQIFNTLHPNWYSTNFGSYWSVGRRKKRPFLLKIGDIVKIVKLYDKTFRKAYRESFSKELYIIVDVVKRFPPLYRLAEYKDDDETTGETIRGNWYGAELFKVVKKS
jgi:transposase InsO family protein